MYTCLYLWLIKLYDRYQPKRPSWKSFNSVLSLLTFKFNRIPDRKRSIVISLASMLSLVSSTFRKQILSAGLIVSLLDEVRISFYAHMK